MALVHRGGLVAVAFLQARGSAGVLRWKQLLQRDLVPALQGDGAVLELEQGLRVDGELLAQAAAFEDRVQRLRRARLWIGGEHQAGRGDGGNRRAQGQPEAGEAQAGHDGGACGRSFGRDCKRSMSQAMVKPARMAAGTARTCQRLGGRAVEAAKARRPMP